MIRATQDGGVSGDGLRETEDRVEGLDMRIDYTEDEDFNGQFELWQANCRRSLRGKAVQAALKRLEAALLAHLLVAFFCSNAFSGIAGVGATTDSEDRVEGWAASWLVEPSHWMPLPSPPTGDPQ